MRRLKLCLFFFLISAGVAFAQSQVRPFPNQFSPLGYQQITSLSASTALTVPAGTNIAVICAETQAVRYRSDGTAPTASVGMPMAAGTCVQFSMTTLTTLQFIEQTASAKLNIDYYR